MKQPEWIVEDVKAREDYTLLITFSGGVQRIYDARPLLEKPLFATLKSLPSSCVQEPHTERLSGMMR